MTAPTNVWNVELEAIADGVRGARLLERPEGTRLVGAVWELDPGASSGPYHVHHGTEELLLVLDGEPTLRSPDGERRLSRGEMVHFPVGAAGAHQILNRSDAPARYLMAAAHSGIDAIEYVDERTVAVYSRSPSLLQEEGLYFSYDLPPEA